MKRLSILLLLFLTYSPPGRGDSYQHQPGIDVVHYDIAVELLEGTAPISGTTRVYVRMTEDGVSKMWLDLADMTVDRVRTGNTERPFVHREGRLLFDLNRAYAKNEIAIVEVQYHGTPNNAGLLIGTNKHGRRVYFAENWPDNAHHWFPSIDHPSDKATVDFSIIAPERFDVVANGKLIESRSLMDGRRLTRWSEGVEIPTYCMVIGAAEFSIMPRGTVAGIPLFFYAYPQDAQNAIRKFARSDLVLQYLSDLVGPYPYEKLAQVESTTRIGGMENAGAIFYSEEEFQPLNFTESPVPHEIAHQWFGDSITEDDWDHIWLSEGFATYFEALFYERMEGPESLKKSMARAAEMVQKFQMAQTTPIIDSRAKDLKSKLNPITYQKGAWVLHMLRKNLGDETFFKGLRTYYSLYAGRNTLSEDFQKVMESVSGISLGEFFHQWLYQPGWPEYRVSWKWDEDAGEVEIVIRQAQKTGLYSMPVDISVQVDGAWVIQTLRVYADTQTYRIPLASKPTALRIDPNGWVLKTATIGNEQAATK